MRDILVRLAVVVVVVATSAAAVVVTSPASRLIRSLAPLPVTLPSHPLLELVVSAAITDAVAVSDNFATPIGLRLGMVA